MGSLISTIIQALTTVLVSVVIKIIIRVAKTVTAEMKTSMRATLIYLGGCAKKTKNKNDDRLVEFVAKIFNINLREEKIL